MKPLIPSQKENKRYLLLNGNNLAENVEKAILEFAGILGMSKVGLSFIKTSKNNFIISINREMVDSVRASFCVFQEKISVEKISGTLKGLGKTQIRVLKGDICSKEPENLSVKKNN